MVDIAGEELEKSSRQITFASLRSRSHRCEPINPAPPVTKTFFFSKIGVSIFYQLSTALNMRHIYIKIIALGADIYNISENMYRYGGEARDPMVNRNMFLA